MERDAASRVVVVVLVFDPGLVSGTLESTSAHGCCYSHYFNQEGGAEVDSWLWLRRQLALPNAWLGSQGPGVLIPCNLLLGNFDHFFLS